MSILVGHVMHFGGLILLNWFQITGRHLLRASIHPPEQKGRINRESSSFLLGVALHYCFQAPFLARIRLPWAIALFIYLFIYFWLCWVFVAVDGLSVVGQVWAILRCGVQASHCGSFSWCRAQALGARASVVVAHRLSSSDSQALECRLSSCGTWVHLLCGMCDLPGPGLEPMSPVWQADS